MLNQSCREEIPNFNSDETFQKFHGNILVYPPELFAETFTQAEVVDAFRELNKLKHEFRSRLFTNHCAIDSMIDGISNTKKIFYLLEHIYDSTQKKILTHNLSLAHEHYAEIKKYSQNIKNSNLSEREIEHFKKEIEENYEKITKLFSEIDWNSIFLNKIVRGLSETPQDSFGETSKKFHDPECLKVFESYTKLHQEILMKNMPMVFYCVKKIIKNSRKTPDAVQNGIIGLSRAIDTYDANHQIRFATLAYKCIWGQIRGGATVEDSHGMLTRRQLSTLSKMNKILSNDINISTTEIAKQLQISVKEAKALRGFSMESYSDKMEREETFVTDSTDEVENVLRKQCISEALSPFTYKLLWEHFLQEKKVEYLSQQYNLSERTIKTYISNGKKTIRDYLNILDSEEFLRKERAILRGFSIKEFMEYTKNFDVLTETILNSRLELNGSSKKSWYNISQELGISPSQVVKLYGRAVNILEYALRNGLSFDRMQKKFLDEISELSLPEQKIFKNVAGFLSKSNHSKNYGGAYLKSIEGRSSAIKFHALVEASPFLKLFSFKNIFPKSFF